MNRKVILTVIFLALIALGLFIAFNNKPRTERTLSPVKPVVTKDGHLRVAPSTKEEVAQGEKIKENTLNSTTSSNSGPQGNVVIKSAVQDSTINKIVIKTAIHGTGYNTCSLTLSHAGKILTKSAGVLYQPEQSSCMGFAIDVSDFPDSGVWQIALSVQNSSTVAITTTASVNVSK